MEVSITAVSEFISEQQIEPRVIQGARFELWESPGYRLICGDFFALEADGSRRVITCNAYRNTADH